MTSASRLTQATTPRPCAIPLKARLGTDRGDAGHDRPVVRDAACGRVVPQRRSAGDFDALINHPHHGSAARVTNDDPPVAADGPGNHLAVGGVGRDRQDAYLRVSGTGDEKKSGRRQSDMTHGNLLKRDWPDHLARETRHDQSSPDPYPHPFRCGLNPRPESTTNQGDHRVSAIRRVLMAGSGGSKEKPAPTAQQTSGVRMILSTRHPRVHHNKEEARGAWLFVPHGVSTARAQE